jgi:predicted TIM-barrel fold metal-dependent hydrolase
MSGADCHVHLFDPGRFPFAASTAYHPVPSEWGDAEALQRVLAAHGLAQALLVNPVAGYAFDNRCPLRRHPDRFRGVAIVAPDAGEGELDALADAGVVGARLDLIQMGTKLVHESREAGLFRRLAARSWFVQVQAQGDQLAEVSDALANCGVRVVVDHCGRPDPAAGTAQPGFRALLDLGSRADAVVKLSGPFRFSRAPYPYPDADPFVDALLDAFTPDRCVWASDWPFLRAPARLDYGPVLALLERWVPDPADRRTILVEAPARAFGFGGER